MTKENLLDTHKEIIEKYSDYEKNNELGYYPENYSKGSHQKVWWKCDECGIIFERAVISIIQVPICKRCISKKNRKIQLNKIIKINGSFLDNYPNLVEKYWDYEENIKYNILPSLITNGTKIKVHLKCSKNHK